VPYRSWWPYDVGQVAQSASERLTRAGDYWDPIDVGHDGGVGKCAARLLGPSLSQDQCDWKRVHVNSSLRRCLFIRACLYRYSNQVICTGQEVLSIRVHGRIASPWTLTQKRAEERLVAFWRYRADAMVPDGNDSAHELWSWPGYTQRGDWARWVKTLI
jgi:hypothetical protein